MDRQSVNLNNNVSTGDQLLHRMNNTIAIISSWSLVYKDAFFYFSPFNLQFRHHNRRDSLRAMLAYCNKFWQSIACQWKRTKWKIINVSEIIWILENTNSQWKRTNIEIHKYKWINLKTGILSFKIRENTWKKSMWVTNASHQ
jgi:hypothetical protein